MKAIKKMLVLLTMLVSTFAMGQYDDSTHWCGSHDKLNQALKGDLSFATKINELDNPTLPMPEEWLQQKIIVPVVVHVVYKDSTEIPSLHDIQIQIEGLNSDFNAENWDNDKTPKDFKKIIADMNIEFRLATKDPKGNKTNGVTYTETDMRYFTMDYEDAKYDELGGKDPWNTSRYLNIWVCELEWNLLGYAQFPGDEAHTDGVVIDYSVFGITDTVTVDGVDHEMYSRVLTHEVGHWTGLYHIWGDWWCGDDKCKDTPEQSGPHRGCYNDEGAKSCGSDDLTSNFMDYVPFDCMVMFTKDQRRRAVRAMRSYRKDIIKYGRKLTK